ncbi:unnamed protein product [Phaedon cochleariae]|uniref:Sugar transporter n=1 Tax=Phaedon cochleariae TaxID=80249 RepID=A0A9N9SHT4_PHACE|nr:unnamed protein product [Phaedon cochleariae]
MKRQLSERGTWKDLFLVRANRRALAAGVFLRVSQQLIGTGTITMYTKFIFEQSEAGLSSETTSMVASGLGLICVFISGFLLEILGRKKLFMWSLGVCSITLIIMGIYFCIEQYAIDINLEAVKWTPMVCTILYTIGIDSGCFSIPTLMAGELFSASIKAKAVSVLIWTYGIMLFVSNNIFHFLNVSVGLYAPFLLFGIISIFSVFITTHLVPETKASISTITYGILFAWTSPFIVKIVEDKENYSITEDEASSFTVIPPISMVLLVPVFEDEESAKKSSRWLRGREDVDEICNKLKIDIKRQLSERGTWKDLFLVKANRRALAAGVFLRVSQQLIGTGTITMYTKFIFERSQAGLSSEITSMVASGLGVICVFISGFLLEILGRKKVYMWSLSSCSLTLIIMGNYFCIEQYATDINLEAVKWTPMDCTILYTIGVDSGCFSIPTLMTDELFSASIKAKAVSVLIWTYGIMIFVSSNIFHLLNVQVGLYAPFLLFGIISIFSVFTTSYLVPETKGKTLEEIQQDLGGDNIQRTIKSEEDGIHKS